MVIIPLSSTFQHGETKDSLTGSVEAVRARLSSLNETAEKCRTSVGRTRKELVLCQQQVSFFCTDFSGRFCLIVIPESRREREPASLPRVLRRLDARSGKGFGAMQPISAGNNLNIFTKQTVMNDASLQDSGLLSSALREELSNAKAVLNSTLNENSTLTSSFRRLTSSGAACMLELERQESCCEVRSYELIP